MTPFAVGSRRFMAKPPYRAPNFRRRGFELLHGRADDFDDVGFETFACRPATFAISSGGEAVHVDQVFAHDRPAMGVRRGEHEFGRA